MKKNLRFLSLLCALLPLAASAQLSESFSGLTLNTVTTATGGTVMVGGMPTGWTQTSLDGLTPYSSTQADLAYMGTNGWITRRYQVNAAGLYDTVAQSISWYNPAGQSNDWLISPSFTPGATDYLVWEGVALDANYPDGYDVLISTTGTATTSFTNTLTSLTSEASGGFVKHAISLAAFAGQTINVAFVNKSNDKYILWIDNINVTSITNIDAQMVGLNQLRFSPTNSNVTITGDVYNNGAPINDLTITWTDGGAPNSATFSGLNLAPYGTYTFSHTIPFNKPVTGEYTINAAITSVNSGATESDITNNTGSAIISTVANPPAKNVVIEEGTGTWCGWCPRGAVAMEHMDQVHTDGSFIGIAVHNNDPMTVTAYDAGAAFSGFPGANVDRLLLGGNVSSADFDTYYSNFKTLVAPVSTSCTMGFNKTTREITINASAAFKTTISTAVNLLAVIVEDSCHGTTTAWDQHNYYSSASQNIALNGAGHNWQNEPNPIVAANMWYFHVGRALLNSGNYSGDAGSVTGPIVDGYSATRTFNYTVPADQKQDNMKIVIMAVDATTGQIYNASETKFHYTTGVNEVASSDINMSVVPNLVNGGDVNVNFNANGKAYVSVYNFAGQVAYQQNLGNVAGATQVKVNTDNMTAGAYFVALTVNGVTYVKNLNVTK
jgi:hypothetical protein